MDDILPGPVSGAVIVDNSYHVSSDVWNGVERGPLECMSSNRSLRHWVLSDAQREILHMVGFGVFANPGIVLQNDTRLVSALVERPDEIEYMEEPVEEEVVEVQGKGKRGKTGKEMGKKEKTGKETGMGKGKGKEELKGKGSKGKTGKGQE
ncbi:hypothetical protein ACET3Z_013268 [Daucus carota]